MALILIHLVNFTSFFQIEKWYACKMLDAQNN
jgi:hypothetical protein